MSQMDQTPNMTNATNTTQTERTAQWEAGRDAAEPHVAGPGMPRWAQVALAVVAALALVGLLVAIGLQIAATQPGSTPAKVVGVQAGPYPLTVSLYKDPAEAGFAMPFAIAPSQPVHGTLTYTISSVPDPEVDATPVNATFGPNPNVPNGVRGTVEITVQGTWYLQIAVNGSAGQGLVSVPITAKPALVIPVWIAWPIGLLPAIGLALFIIAQRRRPRGVEREGEPAAMPSATD